jgi:hypothetical protein
MLHFDFERLKNPMLSLFGPAGVAAETIVIIDPWDRKW